jgi:hypothetical protein
MEHTGHDVLGSSAAMIDNTWGIESPYSGVHLDATLTQEAAE